MRKIFFLIFILFANLIWADTYPNFIWEKILGGNNFDILYSVIKASDNEYIATGKTNSTGAGYNDVWVVKISDNGTVIWEKTFGDSKNEEGRAIIKTDDNNFIIVGFTNSQGNGKYDFLVIKIDADGNKIWEKTFGGNLDDKAYSIAKTSENNFIIAGTTLSKGSGSNDAWLVKISDNGTMIWDKTFGGSDYDGAYDIAIYGNFVAFTGSTTSKGNGQDDLWVVKLYDNGSVIWDKTFGGTNYDSGSSIVFDSNNNLSVAGYTESYGNGGADAWILKLSDNGTVIWEKTFGGASSDFALDIYLNDNGTLFWTGYNGSFYSDRDVLWVMSLDSNGNVADENKFGSIYTCTGNSLVQSMDGFTIIAGRYNNDSRIIKLKLGEVCSSSNLELCSTENDCVKYNGYWYDGSCHASPEEITNKCNFMEIKWVKTINDNSSDYILFEPKILFDSEDYIYIYGYSRLLTNSSHKLPIFISKINQNSNIEWLKLNFPINTNLDWRWLKFYLIEKDSNNIVAKIFCQATNNMYTYIINKNGNIVESEINHVNLPLYPFFRIDGLNYLDTSNNFLLKTSHSKLGMIDSEFNVKWQKDFHAIINGVEQTFFPIAVVLDDNNYFYISGLFRNNSGEQLSGLIKIDKSGNMIWYQILSQNPILQLEDYLILRKIIKLDNDNLLLIGVRKKADSNLYVIWKIILDNNGNFVDDLNFLNLNFEFNKYQILSNENFHAIVEFVSDNETNELKKIKIFDLKGNMLWEKDLLQEHLINAKIKTLKSDAKTFFVYGRSLTDNKIKLIKLVCNNSENLECSFDNIYQCSDETSCLNVGGIWQGNYCDYVSSPELLTNNIGISEGWNLKGVPVNIVHEVKNFGNPNNIETIWKWQGNHWAIWSPDENTLNLVSSYGIPIAKYIFPGEGVWIKSKNKLNIKFKGITSNFSNMFQNLTEGWHLLSTGKSIKSSEFENLFPAIKTLWKWENNKWSIWTPSASIQNLLQSFEIPLADNILSGEGFWINK